MPENTNRIKNISLENLETFAAQMKEKYSRKADLPTAVSALTNNAKYQTENQLHQPSAGGHDQAAAQRRGGLHHGGLPALRGGGTTCRFLKLFWKNAFSLPDGREETKIRPPCGRTATWSCTSPPSATRIANTATW